MSKIKLYLCRTLYLLACLVLYRVGKTQGASQSGNKASCVKPAFALHPDLATRLAMLEEDFVKTLSKLDSSKFTQNHPCFIFLQKYLEEFAQDRQVPAVYKSKTSRAKAVAIAENPNLLLKMIRRISVNMIELQFLCERVEPSVYQIMKSTFESNNLAAPTIEDLNDSLLGLLRIQFVYGHEASKLQQGIFNHVHTNATLTFLDCIFLTDKAIELKGDVLAFQWLQMATSLLPANADNPDIPGNDKELLEESWKRLEMLAGNGKSRGQLMVELSINRQNKLAEMKNFNYYSTCRGERQFQKTDRSLGCFYVNLKWNPYFAINPVKVEKLSDQPKIWHFYDIFGEKFINYVRRTTFTRLERSVVAGAQNKRKQVSERTSFSAFLSDEERAFPVVASLTRTLEILLKLEIGKEEASQFQVVQYGSLGGHYDFHHDAITDMTSPCVGEGSQGNRISTFLMFMNNVKLGGYTAFPESDVHVKPIKGSAVYWFNILPNGKQDVTTHAGCPVILGQKFVANLWIKEYENMWKYPCFS